MGVRRIRKKWGIDDYYMGRRIREVVGKSKKKAAKMLAVRMGEILQGRFSLERVKPTPFFEDFAKEYMEWAKVNHRSWERMDAYRIKCLLRFCKGKGLHEITPWLIEKFKSQRKEEIRPARINRELAVFSSMFFPAIEWGKFSDHPMKGGRVKKFREERVQEGILSAGEEKRLLKASSGWFREMVVMALDTGMKLSELVNLKREDVDINNRVVTVRHTKSGCSR